MNDHDTQLPSERLRINLAAREVWRGGRLLLLGPSLFELLVELARREGTVATHKQLCAVLWGEGYRGPRKALATHMGMLRRKLGDHGSMIRSVRGIGYMLVAGTLVHPVDEPPPSSERQEELDLADVLHASITNLEQYIKRRAAEITAPQVAEIRQQAADRVALLEEEMAGERRRRDALEVELRRRLAGLEQQLAWARAGDTEQQRDDVGNPGRAEASRRQDGTPLLFDRPQRQGEP